MKKQAQRIRIASGHLKGSLIEVPAAIRPTMEKVSVALFNTVRMSKVTEYPFLDLCAGSGAIGLTALSEGFPSALFVDNAHSSTTIIKRNIERLSLQEKSTVYTLSLSNILDKLSNMQFGMVYLDPPYLRVDLLSMHKAILESDILIDDGIICSETLFSYYKNIMDELPVHTIKKYGDTVLIFSKKLRVF